jgi:hypothetical protein
VKYYYAVLLSVLRAIASTPCRLIWRAQSSGAKYESRERRLDVAELVGIARALGVDPLKMLRAAGRNTAKEAIVASYL